MTASDATAYAGLALALISGALVVVFALRVRVKARRAASASEPSVRVYDFGADLKLPPTVNTRSYQIAFYLTMKSLPREPAGRSTSGISAPAAWR